VELAFKIGWRNLWRHKGKSIVIGFILLIGSLLMTVGNGMISGMEAGLSKNMVEMFSGDLVVITKEQKNDDVLLNMTGKPLKVIKNFEAAKKVLTKQDWIEKFLPATTGYAMILDSQSEMADTFLLGVDMKRYQEMFPGTIKLQEGALLKSGEKGVLVSEYAQKQFYEYFNYWVTPKDFPINRKKLPKDAPKKLSQLETRKELVFMGASTTSSTVDVRVPVKGIFKYKAFNNLCGFYSIVDIESFREAYNYVTGADSKVEIADTEKKLLANDELDQLFSSDEIVGNTTESGESPSIGDLKLDTTKAVQKYNPDAGSFNLVFVKLKDGFDADQEVKKLNKVFEAKKVEVRAVTWKQAMGTFGSMAGLIKVALNMFIMFIFFVAMIVIMNTLSMAAMERTAEIGMMRAIGARKGFLSKMFIYETGTLSFFFGGLGIVLGIIIIYLLQFANLSTTNEVLQLVYGGEKLNPLFTWSDLFLGIFELLIVTILSVLYPLRVVGKIVPLDAIARD